MFKKFLIAFLFVIVIGPVDLLSQNISGVINIYTSVNGLLDCGAGVIVDDPAGFNSGDKVLIIQMKGASINLSNSSAFGTVLDYNSAGNYELGVISSVSENRIYFKNKISRTYEITGNIQLVRVPVYDNITVNNTLTCLPWNGSTGGVLIFEASHVTLNASIDISGKGFRGDTVVCKTYYCNSSDTNYFYNQNDSANSLKGEGIIGFDYSHRKGRGPAANGGGGGNNTSGGGGGGANFGEGGIGGYEWDVCTLNNPQKSGMGGRALVYDNSSNKIFLGGAGGMGQGTFIDPAFGGSGGGNGGGIIIIKAGTLEANNYSIVSNGHDGLSAKWDGGGGGGAGGTILLDVKKFTNSLNVDVKGGTGGNPNYTSLSYTGPGGGGGGGVLWMSGSVVSLKVNLNNTGGVNGVFILDSSSWGAAPGNNGGVITNLSIPENNIPAVKIIIPNVFTPNNDGINELFTINGSADCGEYNFQIYNRWGISVFESFEPFADPWDGKTPSGNDADEGTYYYLLTGGGYEYKGFVTLLR